MSVCLSVCLSVCVSVCLPVRECLPLLPLWEYVPPILLHCTWQYVLFCHFKSKLFDSKYARVVVEKLIKLSSSVFYNFSRKVFLLSVASTNISFCRSVCFSIRSGLLYSTLLWIELNLSDHIANSHLQCRTLYSQKVNLNMAVSQPQSAWLPAYLYPIDSLSHSDSLLNSPPLMVSLSNSIPLPII